MLEDYTENRNKTKVYYVVSIIRTLYQTSESERYFLTCLYIHQSQLGQTSLDI